MTAFDLLLAALDPDRDRAGVLYEELRLRLVKFFAWEGCADPDHWADEVLTRVARKLEGGEAIASIAAYAAGVARLALKEALRRQQRTLPLEHDVALPTPAEAEPDDPRANECLARCLHELPAEGRQLILDYYQGDGAQRIRQRHRMAGELGISLNSLRNRALRLRDKLEKCLAECLARDVSPRGNTKEKGDAP